MDEVTVKIPAQVGILRAIRGVVGSDLPMPELVIGPTPDEDYWVIRFHDREQAKRAVAAALTFAQAKEQEG